MSMTLFIAVTGVRRWVHQLGRAIAARLLCAARFLDVAGLRFRELASIACRSACFSTGTSVSLDRATDWPVSPILWKDHVVPLACGPDAVSDLE
jgi:hypothetical protein